ncbi:MAG: hypothetical protein ACQSGP_08460, partial [Frankia sp.]
GLGAGPSAAKTVVEHMFEYYPGQTSPATQFPASPRPPPRPEASRSRHAVAQYPFTSIALVPALFLPAASHLKPTPVAPAMTEASAD